MGQKGTLGALFTVQRPYIGMSYKAWESLGQPMVQPETYKAHYRGLYGQPRLYQAKRPIQVTIGPFTPYLEYKVTIQVITIEPRIHQGQLSIFRAKQDYMGPILMSSIGLKTYQIQLRCHIVHYRDLYGKPTLCERKLTYIL